MLPVCGVKGIPRLSNVFGVVLMLSSFLFHTRGQTLVIESSPTGTTYVKKSEILTLVVNYTYTGNAAVLSVTWKFGKKKIIAKGDSGRVSRFDDRASIKDNVSLVLGNTTVADSGSYSITLDASDVQISANRQFTVIITEQPTAETNCSIITVDQGEDVTCRCSNISGNPPPTASWSKSGVTGTIGGEGYLEKILSLKNVSASDSGTYFCKVQSHDLKGQVSISVKVKSAPVVTSFEADTKDVVLGTSTTITCQAVGFPKPTYTISHNGTKVQTGTNYTIKAVRYEDSGQYKCVASNSLGNSSKRLTLIVKEVTPTVTSKTPNSVTDNGEADDSDSGASSLGAGAVAGIVIGVLCLIIIAIGLVWWFCFKNGGGKERGGDGPAVRAANSRDDNQYDSVEKEGEPSGSRNSAAAVAPVAAPSSSADMPPVYASVDKTKKTKKPPPSSSPTSVQYASLDPVALQPDSSRMRVRETNDTQYADLDLEKLQSDLV